MRYTQANTHPRCTVLVDGKAASEVDGTASKVISADTVANVVECYVHPLKIVNDYFETKTVEAKDVQVVEPADTYDWLSRHKESIFRHSGDAYRLVNFATDGAENVNCTMDNVSGGLPPEDIFDGSFSELMRKYRLEV